MVFNPSLKRGILISLGSCCCISLILVIQTNPGWKEDYSNTASLHLTASISNKSPTAAAAAAATTTTITAESPLFGSAAQQGRRTTTIMMMMPSDGFRRLMKERSERVKKICAAMSVPEKKLKVTQNYHNLRILHERGIVYCPVFKASSSNWRENLFELFPLPAVIETIFFGIYIFILTAKT